MEAAFACFSSSLSVILCAMDSSSSCSFSFLLDDGNGASTVRVFHLLLLQSTEQLM